MRVHRVYEYCLSINVYAFKIHINVYGERSEKNIPLRAACFLVCPEAPRRLGGLGLIVVRVIELLQLSLELLHLHPHRPLRRRPLLRVHLLAQLVVHACGNRRRVA